jgi:hypothetical protein
LLEAGIPFVAFDPIGIWKYLRVAGKGPGYSVVVAGGRNGDLPLTPQSAPEIVRAAMRENIPLVIDLYDIHLSKADWKKVVEQSVRLLLYENGDHGLRHIFIEEAAEFCPQRIGPDQGSVYAEIEKLARMGGNALLGYTLINQRAEEVNKAVLELCDCLFLHRQKGRNSLTALSKWLDIGDVSEARPIIKSLPTLPQGECWVWSAGSDTPVRVKIPTKNTFHPDRRAMGTAAAQGKGFNAIDVSSFVATMSTSLERHLTAAKENDPAELRKRIATFERELRAKPAVQKVEQIIERVEIPIFRDGEVKALQMVTDQLVSVGNQLIGVSRSITDAVQEATRVKPSPPVIRPSPPAPTPTLPRAQQASTGGGERLPKAEKSILIVLAQYLDGRTLNQVAILSGYAIGTGGFNNAIGALRSKHYIHGGREHLQITDAGLDALGPVDPLPTGQDLIDYWRRKLSKAEWRAFDVLIDIYPAEIERDDLAERAGYAPGTGGINNAISRLCTLELAVRDGKRLRANETLFE